VTDSIINSPPIPTDVDLGKLNHSGGGHQQAITFQHGYHCKKGLFWLNLVTSVSYLFYIIKYSGDTLPALHSRFSRTLVNVMRMLANKTVQWCGKV